MKKIQRAFVTGILVLVPLLATVDILLWFFRTVDNSIRYFLPTFIIPFDFWGLGFVVALALILIAGLLTQNYIGKWFVALFDSFMQRITFVGGIYGAIKKFLETIFNPRSDKFHDAVLVEFPRAGIYSIGFRTGRPDAKIQRKETKRLANIFVPCTPNPTSGFYLLVPEEALVPLDMTVQEAFKIVISMGIVSNDEPTGVSKT